MTGRGPAAGSHQCPARDCGQQVGPGRLMCRPHWYMVPRPLRDAMWATWRSGQGAGTEAHQLACDAAIRAVNSRLGES